MPLHLYLPYVVACAVVIAIPGPTVTLIVANSIRHGARAGLLNVLGTQIAMGALIVIVGVGLASAMQALGHWFEWLRVLGAAYLVWLGLRLWRARGGSPAAAASPRGGFVTQGFLVAISNPKMLLFLGAFLPQFIDPPGNHGLQIAIMGLTAMAIGILSDGAYALLAGGAGRILSPRRLRLINRVSGSFLIGGGLWLATSRIR